VTLHHAADADYRAAGAALLEPARFDERVNGLFLRGVNEAAGVDDDDFRLGEIGRELGAAVRQLCDVAFAIDGILVAAECEEGELQRARGWSEGQEPGSTENKRSRGPGPLFRGCPDR